MIKPSHLLASCCLSLSGTLLSAGASYAADFAGAGATFPQPIYTKWAEAYKSHTGAGMNYQPVGSGNGIQQIQAKTVDFGATDAPLSPGELASAGLTQFPTVIGGVVPVVNIPGISPNQLKLDSKVLADIYLGKITKWNDSRIVDDNVGLVLPAETIKILYRSDTSGTSFIFTSYLAQISPEWARNVGKGTSVRWPTGTGGKGNEGVVSYVQRIKYSIGYVGYAFALQNRLTYTQLRNLDGQFVKADAASFKASAANIKWNKDNGFYETTTSETGTGSWPITGATFILMQKNPAKPENAAEVLKFFDWAFTHGDSIAAELNYVPLPATALAMVRDSWKSQIKNSAGAPLWK